MSLVAVAVRISYSSTLGAEPFAFIRTSPVGMLDPQNMGVAIGISLLSCLQAEIAWGGGIFTPPPPVK